MTEAEKTSPKTHSAVFELKQVSTAEDLTAALEHMGAAVSKGRRTEKLRAYYDTQSGSRYRKGERKLQKGRDLPDVLRTAKRPLIKFVEVLESTDRWHVGVGDESLEMAVSVVLFRDPYSSALAHAPQQLTLTSPSEALLAKAADAMGEHTAPLLERDELDLAIELLQLTPPGAPVPSELVVTRDDSALDAAGKVLRTQAMKLMANARFAMLGADPEFVHDMRVATRRARFALRIFDSVLGRDRASGLRKELGVVARTLGPLRDLDVFIASFLPLLSSPGAPEMDTAPFLAAVESLHRERMAMMGELLASEDFPRIVKAMERIGGRRKLRERKWASRPVEQLAQRRAEAASDALWDLIDDAPYHAEAERLHEVRIAIKGLRYTIEFFREVLPGSVVASHPMLVELQDCLGRFNDCTVAEGIISDIAYADASPEVASVAISLSSRLLLITEAMRRDFDRLATDLRG